MVFKRSHFAVAAAAAGLALAGPASATVLDDFNSGTLITDFQFNDIAGTELENALNSAAPGSNFDIDADIAGTQTNGLGQFDASPKANTDFGSNYVNIAGITTGRVIGLFDISYNFATFAYDPAQDEEMRLTFIQFDPRSTFVTAEIFFTRTAVDEVTLYGNGVGTGATDTPDVILAPVADILTMIDVDLDNDVFELFYSFDDGASFTSAGTGTLDPTRGIESVRLVLNEDFSDDTMLIDRFAVSHIIPEPASLALFGLMGLGMLRRRA